MIDHPITPPAELVQQWSAASPIQSNDENWAYELFIAHRAAQWGADTELDACCAWLDKRFQRDPFFSKALRAARRPSPKPPETIEDDWLHPTDLGRIAAAALRAAADQVAPETPHSEPDDPEMLKGIWDERRTIRAELLAIAAELEGKQ